MIKYLKKKEDRVTPDTLTITDLRIALSHMSREAMCISFDGNTVHIGNADIKHPGFHAQLRTNNLYDFRLWYKAKLITLWIRNFEKDETKDVRPVLKSLKKAFDNGNIELYNITNLKEFLPNGLDDFSFVYVTYENGENYIVKCGFDEIDKVENVGENIQRRELHLVTPMLKKHYIAKNPELRNERQEYFREGERSWVAKHGNIDPAYWHLLMYEE